MAVQNHRVWAMFPKCAADLVRVRPDLPNTVACPLCLRMFGRGEIGLLSVEHAIPSKLGGKIETLACTRCNNRDGSRLDKHLVAAMRALDGLEGRSPIKAAMNRGGHVSMDVHLKNDGGRPGIEMEVVGKASTKSAVEGLLVMPPKQGESLALRLDLGFIPERYWMAVLRSAYLSIFSVEGYGYAHSEGASQVRRVMRGQEPLESGVIAEALPDSELRDDALVMPVRLKHASDFYAVLLRMRSARIRYLCVVLPGKQGNEWSALKLIGGNAPRLRIETTPAGSKSKMYIRLNTDPVTAFRARMLRLAAPGQMRSGER